MASHGDFSLGGSSSADAPSYSNPAEMFRPGAGKVLATVARAVGHQLVVEEEPSEEVLGGSAEKEASLAGEDDNGDGEDVVTSVVRTRDDVVLGSVPGRGFTWDIKGNWLSRADFEWFRERFVPPFADALYPENRFHDPAHPPQGYITVYTSFFENGFRILSEGVMSYWAKIVSHFRIPLAQFMPKSISYLVCYLIAAGLRDPPSVNINHVRCLFAARKKEESGRDHVVLTCRQRAHFGLDAPSKLAHPKDRFFFVRFPGCTDLHRPWNTPYEEARRSNINAFPYPRGSEKRALADSVFMLLGNPTDSST